MALTRKQNLLETIHGGKPDRLVNQYEYMAQAFDPCFFHYGGWCDPGTTKRSDWGFYNTWPEGIIAPFPMHDDEHLLIKDVTQWRDYVTVPDPRSIPDEEWEQADAFYAQVDRDDKYVAAQMVPGIFEKLHYMMGIDNACINLLMEPEAMEEMVDMLTEWEIEVAKCQIEHFHPNAVFHHDDFGSQNSLLMSPETWEEFFVPAYKKVYGFYRDNGVELVVHHSDSYGEPIVPLLIEMGVDIWQGTLSSNDIPKLIEEYGGQISFQGGMNNGIYDMETCTREELREGLEALIESAGIHYIIPSMTAGGPASNTEFVYPMLSEEIDALSKRLFKE